MLALPAIAVLVGALYYFAAPRLRVKHIDTSVSPAVFASSSASLPALQPAADADEGAAIVHVEVDSGAADACFDEYLSRVDVSSPVAYVAGRTVMMDPKSVRVMCGVLAARPSASVLEWGAGGSTAFFSRYAGRWESVEHDRKWKSPII